MSKLGAQLNHPHGSDGLETFSNPLVGGGSDNAIDFVTEEFTCLCPKTKQPDFARIRIRYKPDRVCVESKSLKLYLWHFRDRPAFHEAVTKEIADDLNELLEPRWLQVLGEFNIRGGIAERVLVSHGELGRDALSL